MLLAAVGLVSSVTAQYFAAKAAVGFSTKLRHILFEKIESLSFSKMDTGYIDTYHEDDRSDINSAVRVNLVLRLFPSLAIDCIRSYGDGFYSKCKSGNGFMNYHTSAFNSGILSYDCKPSALQKGAELS